MFANQKYSNRQTKMTGLMGCKTKSELGQQTSLT